METEKNLGTSSSQAEADVKYYQNLSMNQGRQLDCKKDLIQFFLNSLPSLHFHLMKKKLRSFKYFYLNMRAGHNLLFCFSDLFLQNEI